MLMELNLLTHRKETEPLLALRHLFAKVNLFEVDKTRPMEEQVGELDGLMDESSFDKILVYPRKLKSLGVVLSRWQINSIMQSSGPLKLGKFDFSIDHISKLPGEQKRREVLVVLPHPDEEYLGIIALHKIIGDSVTLYSFTSTEKGKHVVERAYETLGLTKNEYIIDTFKFNQLFRYKENMKRTIRELLSELRPDTVISIYPLSSNFDHITVAQCVDPIVLGETSANLIYGYTIQSRPINPSMFPIYTKNVYDRILDTFGRRGFAESFKRYMPFLKRYLQHFSEPIWRLLGEKKLENVFTVPLQPRRLTDYLLPFVFTEN
jgi:hypothetical protein